jgi:MATE family multidrug resistance protein
MLKTMTTYFDPASDQAARREMLKPWIAEARALLILAGPLIAMQLAQIGSLTADIIMVGELGTNAIAATQIGSFLYFLAWLIGYGPVAAVSPIVAQILGRHPNDRARTRAAVRMGLWSVAIIAVPLMIALLWARPALLAFGQQPEIVALASPWVNAMAIAVPFALGFGVLRGFTTAIGNQRAVLAIAVGQVLVNIAMNYVLIYGNLGAPAFGVVGSAYASVIANVFAFTAMLTVVLVAPAFRKYHLLHRFWRPDWRKMKEIFRLGVPMGISILFEAMLFNSATLMMGILGAASLAAHGIAMNVGSVTFMVPLGIGLAATVRVGLFVGGRNIAGARRAGYTAIAFGAGFMALCAVVIALIPETLVGLYIPAKEASNAEVVRLAVSFLYMAAVFQLFDALQVTGQMSLRGMKDATAPMWIAGLSYWLVGFTLSYTLAFWAGLEGFGIWIGLAAGLAVAGLGMVWRFEILSRRTL